MGGQNSYLLRTHVTICHDIMFYANSNAQKFCEGEATLFTLSVNGLLNANLRLHFCLEQFLFRYLGAILV